MQYVKDAGLFFSCNDFNDIFPMVKYFGISIELWSYNVERVMSFKQYQANIHTNRTHRGIKYSIKLGNKNYNR